MFKQDLLLKYQELTASNLRYLLNVKYFSQLSPLGYKKNDKYLAPCVVRKFIELFGKPINGIDLNDEL